MLGEKVPAARDAADPDGPLIRDNQLFRAAVHDLIEFLPTFQPFDS
jgi:hypothetical protein